jgi:cysteine protease ATG4
MALAGKEQGTDVGQWFGPSTAAGAIKSVLSVPPAYDTSTLTSPHRTLVHSFPDAGLGVSVAADGTLFQSDVFAASHRAGAGAGLGSPKRHHARGAWGERAVLVLVGIRLGLDGVNPIYYETIKVRLFVLFSDSYGL